MASVLVEGRLNKFPWFNMERHAEGKLSVSWKGA